MASNYADIKIMHFVMASYIYSIFIILTFDHSITLKNGLIHLLWLYHEHNVIMNTKNMDKQMAQIRPETPLTKMDNPSVDK